MELKAMKAFKMKTLLMPNNQETNAPVAFKNVNGDVCTTLYAGLENSYANIDCLCNTNIKYGVLKQGNGCLWLGTNGTDVTENDYQITPVADADLSIVQATTTNVVDNGKVYMTLETTFRNESASDITVSEVGYIKHFWVQAYNNAKFLLARETFEATTIAPQGTLSKSITFVLS